jgi:hypothetical protein
MSTDSLAGPSTTIIVDQAGVDYDRPLGAAYETWIAAIASADLDHAHHHANILRGRKELAAEYLQDLSGLFAAAAKAAEGSGQPLRARACPAGAANLSHPRRTSAWLHG